MHRRDLLAKLDRYQPEDDSDRRKCELIKRFIKAHSDCFERTLAEGHITASAWVADATGQKVLLTQHKKLKKWLQLGGHADGQSDVLAVALREAEEESGIYGIVAISREIFDVDIHEIPAYDAVKEHLHYDIRFALRADSRASLSVSDESRALSWVPINELERYTKEESLLRMARKWERDSFQM